MPILLAILLFFAAPALAADMDVSTLGTQHRALPTLLLDEEPADDPDLEIEEAEMLQLDRAYSSLYATQAKRRENERRALWMAILGGALGWLAGGLGAVVTFGVGGLALPAAVALGAAYGVDPFLDARLGWEVVGGLVGAATGTVLAVSAGFFAGDARNGGVFSGSVLFGAIALLVSPGIGAWFAGITDQDNLERMRIKYALGPIRTEDGATGAGVRLRF